LAAAVEPVTLNITGDVDMQSGSVYAASVGSAGTDHLYARGSVVLEEDTSIRFQIDAMHPFEEGTYTLITAEGEEGLLGPFDSSEGLGEYVSIGPGNDGLEYVEEGIQSLLKLTIDYDLHPGDANLDTKTNVLDFNEWNANKFTSPTKWGEGDFNGDGKTNVLDFNVWNENKFTSATDARLVEGQIPEPSTLILLTAGVLGLLLVGRRFRTVPGRR
jgi:hypothetical protein